MFNEVERVEPKRRRAAANERVRRGSAPLLQKRMTANDGRSSKADKNNS